MAQYRRWALEQFSGTLCVDELHLGRYALLLATDPLGDFPLAYANDQDHMRRFLKTLKTWGFSPETVITHGSNLYPTVLALLWPQARHQLCIFHVMEDITGTSWMPSSGYVARWREVASVAAAVPRRVARKATDSR